MRYTFADCTFDTQLYVLRRAGTPQRLRPKVFQLLQYLMQHRDRVVSKQELAEQFWPAQFIGDAVVENTVMAVRRAVGDSGRAQYVIQTLPGHGYRFVAPVAEATTAFASSEAPLSSIATGISIVSVPAELQREETLVGETPPGEPLLAFPCLPCPETMPASRRQLTVLSYDLVDASALARQLDLDDLHDVMHALHQACAEVIQRYEGTMARHHGAGMVVYFGYPVAHEDDAARAVQTGLGLVEAVEACNSRLEHEHGVRLTMRLGIHTGLVIMEADR